MSSTGGNEAILKKTTETLILNATIVISLVASYSELLILQHKRNGHVQVVLRKGAKYGIPGCNGAAVLSWFSHHIL